MPLTRSRQALSRIVLIGSSLALLALVAWVAFRVFEPVEIPPVMPSQSLVSFNAENSIEKNRLFGELQEFVSSDFVISPVGNKFPLGGDPKKKTPKGYDNKSVLATASEIRLNGILVKDIALRKDGGIYALLNNVTSDGQIHYEIRRYGANGSEEGVVAQWNAFSRLDLRVAGITIDQADRIWLLSEKGQVGMVTSNASPTWLTGISTGLAATDPQKLAISSDSLDRIWLSDGVTVSMGGEKGFTPLNISAELTDDQRMQYDSIMRSQASQLGLQSLTDSNAFLAAALTPRSFYPLSDGRMGLLTTFGAILFPQSQSARVTWVPSLQFSVIPYGISDNGVVWGSRHTDRAFVRIQNGQEYVLPSGPGPDSTKLMPSAMSFVGDAAFVYEKLDTLTNWWMSSSGSEWSTKLVSTSGTQSTLSEPLKIKADEETNDFWMLMKDGYLYRVTAGATVESPPLETSGI